MQGKPISIIKGIKDATSIKFAKLGIATIYDLIFHFPLRYQDRTHLTHISDLIQGKESLIQGTIIESKILYYGKKGLQVTLQDKQVIAHLKFFFHSYSLQKAMRPGSLLRCYGEPRMGRSGAVMEMVHPECSFISNSNPQPLDKGLTPVYPLTKGISQRKMREMIAAGLAMIKEEDLPELVANIGGSIESTDSAGTKQDTNNISILQALKFIHSPPPDADIASLMAGTHPTQFKLALEEVCAHRLLLLRDKLKTQQHQAPELPPCPDRWAVLRTHLPFTPTKGQENAFEEIGADLTKGVQMTRLLQGDVGCGKTLVAAYAVLQAATANYQSVLMAPTEILADQHISQFTEWFLPLGLSVVPLLGKMSESDKRNQIQIIQSGQADLIIGTHALFQQNVEFARLGLIIVDEQQRFGVKQRHLMQEKGVAAGVYPHQLIMSATPIPRTLAQTLLANMDVTSIKEMPPGRIHSKTTLLKNSGRTQLVERLKVHLRNKAQVYWVCPLIEDSEFISAENVNETTEELQRMLPSVKIAVVHGKIPPADKNKIMLDFKQGKIQVLVATTVIEVGIDVPQANFMIIENAERLGLSQLHQLRGRVGRGMEESHCVLLYNEPLSDIARQRLEIMETSNSGFDIAEADLRLRGAGEIIGIKQSGAMQFKVADLFKHQSIISQSAEITKRMIEMPEDRQLALISRWIGDEQKYGVV